MVAEEGYYHSWRHVIAICYWFAVAMTLASLASCHIHIEGHIFFTIITFNTTMSAARQTPRQKGFNITSVRQRHQHGRQSLFIKYHHSQYCFTEYYANRHSHTTYAHWSLNVTPH